MGKHGGSSAVVDIMFRISSPELMLRLHHSEARERHEAASAPRHRGPALTAAHRLPLLLRRFTPPRVRTARSVFTTDVVAVECRSAAVAC